MKAAVLLMLLLPAFGAALGSEPDVFDIPPVRDIVIDGSADDWGGGGFRVELLPDPDGRLLSADDFDVRFRLGWDNGGLFVLVMVNDDVPDEHEEEKRIWQKDCVELFLAGHAGDDDMYQVVLSPGADRRYGSIRTRLYDHRPEPDDQVVLETEQASSVNETGYVIEVFLPWKNLGIEPRVGTEAAFQLIANDSDGRGEPVFRTAWFPAIGAHEDTRLMNTVRLAESPSEPVTISASRRSTMDGCVVTITGASEETGSAYSIISKGVERTGKLEDLSGRAGAVEVIRESDGGTYPPMTVSVSGREVARFAPVASMDHILGRYVEALGGREALEKIDSRRCECRSATEPLKHAKPAAGGSGGESRFRMTVDSEGRWLYEDLSSDPPVRRGSNGSESWVQDRNGIHKEDLSGFGVTVWWIDPLGALRIDRYFVDLEVVEPGSGEDKNTHVISGKLPGGRAIRLVFDPATGLLEKAGRLNVTSYREIDGVQIPHLIYFDTSESRTRFFIDEVTHNAELDEGMFDAPDPVSEYPDIFSGIVDERVLPMLKELPTVNGGMNVPAADGRFLYDLIVEKGYRRGLEIGTSNGYSALWLGLAFRETGGKVITIEYDPKAGLEAKENFEKAGLEGVIDLRINDAFGEIPGMEGDFDFVFIDAWKPDYIKFLEMIRHRVVQGGAITAHNVISQDRYMGDYLEAIENDPGLETSIIERSTEGISLSIVRE